MITLDIKQAFDCVKTDGLSKDETRYYTKSDGIINQIDSYYANRKQFKKWCTANSQTFTAVAKKTHPLIT